MIVVTSVRTDIAIQVIEGGIFEPDQIAPALEKAQAMMHEFRVPVVVEIILERVTNIAMGTDIDAINEFNDVLNVA